MGLRNDDRGGKRTLSGASIKCKRRVALNRPGKGSIMEASHAARRPGGWSTVWVLALVWTMAMLDRLILLLLIPGIKTTMGLSDTEVSLLYGLAFALCFSVVGLGLGHLADRGNRRN